MPDLQPPPCHGPLEPEAFNSYYKAPKALSGVEEVNREMGHTTGPLLNAGATAVNTTSAVKMRQARRQNSRQKQAQQHPGNQNFDTVLTNTMSALPADSNLKDSKAHINTKYIWGR